MINGGDTLELKNLGYEDMAGTYMCTVRGVGGQCSGSSTLEVYCEYYSKGYILKVVRNKIRY